MHSIDLRDNRSEKVHYDFEDHPIYIRKAQLSSYNNFEAPPHWHDDIEFIAVLQGEMSYNINGEIIDIRQNEGVFVNSRQLHYGFSKSKTECEFICVLLHPLMLCVILILNQPIDKLSAIISSFCVKLPCQATACLRSLFLTELILSVDFVYRTIEN